MTTEGFRKEAFCFSGLLIETHGLFCVACLYKFVYSHESSQIKYEMGKTGLSSRKIFTLLIVAFLVHNCEEAIMMNGKAAESPVEVIKPLTYSQFLFAVSFLSIIVLAIYIFAIKTRNNKTYLFISMAIAAGLLINAFIPHIVVALYTLNYTPGLVTAVLFILPISMLLLSKNKPLFESRRQMVYQIVIGLATAYGVFAITIVVAKLLI